MFICARRRETPSLYVKRYGKRYASDSEIKRDRYEGNKDGVLKIIFRYPTKWI